MFFHCLVRTRQQTYPDVDLRLKEDTIGVAVVGQILSAFGVSRLDYCLKYHVILSPF